MKYYLSIDFYNLGEITELKQGDVISFVSFERQIKTGTITNIIYLNESKVPTKYRVDCEGKNLIAVSDYVIRKDSKILNLKTQIEESENGFPLRT
jgi:hypothetical protein